MLRHFQTGIRSAASASDQSAQLDRGPFKSAASRGRRWRHQRIATTFAARQIRLTEMEPIRHERCFCWRAWHDR